MPVALLAGLLSFASPCFLPVVPAVVAQVVGDGRATGGRRLATSRTAAFVAGFTAVFITVWASFGVIGRALGDHRDLARIVGGVVLVVMGLHLAGLVEIPLLNRQWRVSRGSAGSRNPGGHGRALVLGLAFGAGWTPCIGPVLGAVLGLAASGDRPTDGALLLLAYCLGLGLPLLAVAASAGAIGSRLAVLRRHAGLVELTSGALVSLTGLALVANLFGRLAAALPQVGG